MWMEDLLFPTVPGTHALERCWVDELAQRLRVPVWTMLHGQPKFTHSRFYRLWLRQ